MAGYSGTPLSGKLGIKEGHRVVLLDAPEGFASALEPLPPVAVATALRARADVVVLFVSKRTDLARRVGAVKAKMAPAGGLWVAWPKKAIDEVWSGLRLVIRKELRNEKKRP